MYQLIVYGEPKAKGRPRFARRGKFVHTYTDAQTVSKEGEIKMAFKSTGLPKIDPHDEIILHVRVFRPIPKSMSKKKRLLISYDGIRPTTKPDADNYLKLVCDALNGLAWHDDAQIVDERCEKLYSDQPRLEIRYCAR